MPGIFVNYRRDDTSGYAGRLYDRLVTAFGKHRVFMDLDIEPGVDFEAEIRNRVGACDVLLVIIGRQWLTVTDPATGQRRIDNPQDWTRIEIESALARGVRVIPVLVHAAQMPTSDVLPDQLKKLASRNAIELTDARWEYDVGRLLDTLKKVTSSDALRHRHSTTPGEPARKASPIPSSLLRRGRATMISQSPIFQHRWTRIAARRSFCSRSRP